MTELLQYYYNIHNLQTLTIDSLLGRPKTYLQSIYENLIKTRVLYGLKLQVSKILYNQSLQ